MAHATKEKLKAGLEDWEISGEGRPPWVLSWPEVKLLGITGVGFFLDAYDLFIINQVSVMLQWRLFGGKSLPTDLEGVMKAGANIGCVIGQFGFGFLGDSLGRKAVYGKELIVIIFATIGTICCPTGALSPRGSLIWIACWRIVLGIGIGGDYPLSSSVTSDRAHLRKRGTMLAYIFSNQGWGAFVGCLVTMATLGAYHHAIDHKGSRVDGAWRIVIALALIPAFGTLYQRLTLPESTRYNYAKKAAQRAGLKADDSSSDDLKPAKVVKDGEHEHEGEAKEEGTPLPTAEELALRSFEEDQSYKKDYWKEFVVYFSEWRHLKWLIGTTMSWFLVDVAFYGINLNQSVVLQQIGFAGKGESEYQSLFHIATGNLIITALGFVPGYWVTILTIEWLGRKPIQIMGFLVSGMFLGILAGKFHDLSIPAFVVCFALMQFFFNFGANATTFLYPSELFPTRVRSTAHGMSAAFGKAGAIISSLAFNTVSKRIGTPKVLWIFFACNMAGALTTLLLPEVKGRDPDLVDEEERREARAKQGIAH